jgi:hypothetical protein
MFICLHLQDESDLSDSEMFKIDAGLAVIMRQLQEKRNAKKAKKERNKEAVSLRLRALDLLEVIVHGDRCGDFILVRGLFTFILWRIQLDFWQSEL